MATLLGGKRWLEEDDVYEQAKSNHFHEFDDNYDDVKSNHFKEFDNDWD